MTPDEEWRAIVGYEGAYEVSNLGRVRSLDRRVHSGRGRERMSKGRTLSLWSGDHYVKVRLKLNGTGSTRNVHALVAAAFLGPRPDGLEVCHNNGQHHDNRAANLRYDTHSANQRDTVALGLNPNARKTHCNQGHEYTPENTIRRSDSHTGRKCLTCETARGKRRWAEHKEAS